MGMREFESMILAELKEMTGNRKLRIKDMMEWSTGEIKGQDGETRFFLPRTRVYVCIKSSLVPANPAESGLIS